MTDSPAVPAPTPLPGDDRRHRLPARTVRYWQIWNAVLFGPLLAGAVVAAVLWTAAPLWLRIVLPAACLVVLAVAVLVDPPLRHRRFSYAVGDEEIDIAKGILLRSRTIVPMTRVQHLRMSHGVIADRFRLADLHVHTGAGVVVLPGLARDEAELVRTRVAALAQLSDDL